MTGAAFGASQPLPRGKENFSMCLGNFDPAGATWVRMGNWTFNSSAGTVAATYWQWDSTLERGKTVLNSHTCTQGGASQTCNCYTPTGWMAPGGYSFNWSGSYTYDTGTSVLTIVWSNGNGTEQWVVSNPAAMMSIRCYGGTATLDLSGLKSFGAAVNQLTVGCEGYTQAAGQNRPGGTLYLARTNFIRGYSTVATAAGSGLPLAIGESRVNAGNKSWVYLGCTNVFLANFGIVVGGARSLGQLQFNPGNPTPGVACFRNLAGTGRQSEWRIGDNNTSSTGTGANGTADFTGGTVDARVDLLYVGRGQPSANIGSGIGALLIPNGIVDANHLRIGYMNASSGDPGPCSGTVTTIGGAAVTNLMVNNDIVLGRDIGANYNAQGTLNIGSAVIVKGNVVDGGGTGSSVTLDGGWLWVGGKLGNNGGVNDRPIGTLNLTSGTLTLDLGSAGNPLTPVCNASHLNIGAITLNVSGTGLSAGVIPLLKEYTSLGGSFASITPGTIPAQTYGYFSNSLDTCYLVITKVGTPIWNGVSSFGWAGDRNFQMSGTGAADQPYHILATTDAAAPRASWTPVSTGTFAGGAFSFTDLGSTNYSRRFYRVVTP
jgi:hypothetical protein